MATKTRHAPSTPRTCFKTDPDFETILHYSGNYCIPLLTDSLNNIVNNMRKILIFMLLCLLPTAAPAQNSGKAMSLKDCLDYSLEHNTTLQKDRISLEAAALSIQEVVGALLPQLNGSGGYTYNIDKTTFAMPNFVNSMLPEPMRDPNAPKYMTVTMGMDMSANWAVTLTQQLLNFSIYSAVDMARTAGEMAELGIAADTDDVIAKTASLFYNTQVLEYSLGLFDESLGMMTRMTEIMEANRNAGLVRNVDADRISVTRMNLETEKSSLVQALDVQKNLLKLQMGFPMEESIEIEPISLDGIESMVFLEAMTPYELEEQLPFKMFKQQQEMLKLQRKSAISEVLPSLVLTGNYSMNYMGDKFSGETYHRFPVSMVSVNLRVPIFTGMSKSAKIKKTNLEIEKSLKDEETLRQSLTMGYNNARMQMDQNRRTIVSQRRNKDLASDVLKVTESNYKEGIASLSDLLNASSSLVQAQMNYVNALSNSIKAFIDLKKADGTIQEINK